MITGEDFLQRLRGELAPLDMTKRYARQGAHSRWTDKVGLKLYATTRWEVTTRYVA